MNAPLQYTDTRDIKKYASSDDWHWFGLYMRLSNIQTRGTTEKYASYDDWHWFGVYVRDVSMAVFANFVNKLFKRLIFTKYSAGGCIIMHYMMLLRWPLYSEVYDVRFFL
jgi:hypothetical protein